MTSPEFIRATLVNRTKADCSEQTVKNNHYHYLLKFDNPIGWDWLYGQVNKAEKDVSRKLELWKIRPSGVDSFEVEVREVAKRPDIDSGQNSLFDFEE